MEEYATDLQLRNIALQTAHIGGVELRFGDNHDQLPDTFVVGHGVIDGIDPAIHFFAVSLAEEARFVLRRGCGRGERKAKCK